MFLLNGQPLSVDTAFTVGDIQYPSNWLRLATPAEKEALGITEVPDQIRPDDRFYWVSQNPDGGYTAIPKDLDQVKALMVSQIKVKAGSMLAPTDWRVIRGAEGVKPLDQETKTKRKAIRDASDLNEAAVLACQGIPELATLTLIWPTEE